MQIPLGEFGAYGLQAWLLSVTGAAWGATKIALMIKEPSAKSHVSGNGKLLMAKDAGRFETQILTLTERVVEVNETVLEAQQEDREQWAPALKSLLESQNKMMKTLDTHNRLAEEHRDRMQTIWKEMLDAFNTVTDKVAALPCTKENGNVPRNV